ncbi:MAG: serine/threonine-protein phosphatase [Spirochaetales bacterium]|nr:serine/threonine-protein phosphatase [Spirochaetales bacterium]
MIYSFLTDRGKIRTGNEDFIALPGKKSISDDIKYGTDTLGWLFVLCDGMGGANAGEVASSMAGSMLMKEYYSLDRKPDDPGFFLTEKILDINYRILRWGLKVPDYYGMGTTLVSLLIDGRTAYINSVGDSRVYRLRGGSLEQITEDQSLVWEYYRSGKMTKEEIRKHPRNNILTCALGTDTDMLLSSIESYRMNIENDDQFLLCSDGLSDMLSDREMEEILVMEESADHAAERLLAKAMKNGGKDNISLILVRS